MYSVHTVDRLSYPSIYDNLFNLPIEEIVNRNVFVEYQSIRCFQAVVLKLIIIIQARSISTQY